MSSLHQDRLLAQGSEPTTGSAPALATGRGTTRRPAEKKATATVPTQRQGMASDSEATSTRTDRSTRPARTRRTAGATSDATKTPAAQAAAAEPLDSPVDVTGEAPAVVADVAAKRPLARLLHRRPPRGRRGRAPRRRRRRRGEESACAVAPPPPAAAPPPPGALPGRRARRCAERQRRLCRRGRRPCHRDHGPVGQRGEGARHPGH